MPRRLPLALGFVLFLAALGWWFIPRQSSAPPVPPAATRPSLPSASSSVPAPSPVAVSPEAAPPARAADLNSPRFDVTHDLQLLNDLFTNWRLDFPRTSNPIGENAEITAAFTGDNRLRLAYLPRDHPAINATGELCDRWGTPFRFHALAADRMELRSAGPDRRFGTADDALLTPP